MATHSFLCSASTTNPLALIQDQVAVKDAKKAGTPASVRPSKTGPSKTITLGQSAALSGNLEKYQQEINHGIAACIKKINAEGGVRGHKLALKVVNNNNNPAQATVDIENLRTNGIDIFIGNAGSRNIKAALPFVKNKEIALFFPWGCSLDTDNHSIPYLIHGQTDLRMHLRKLVSHLAGELHHTKIGIVHADSAFGSLNARYAQQLFKTYNEDPIEVTTCSYNSHTADTAEALATLNKTKPHAVLFLSTSRPTAKIIKGIGEAGNYATDFVGTESNFFACQQFDNPDIKFHYSSSVPSLDRTEYPIVAEYLEASKKYLPHEKPNSLSFTYYINTKILAQAIEKVLADKNKVTKETVIAALDHIRNKDIGGFIGEFNRKTRILYPINVSIVKG